MWFPRDVELPEQLDGIARDSQPKENDMKRPELKHGTTLVRFTKTCAPYMSGDVAGFSKEYADWLVHVVKCAEPKEAQEQRDIAAAQAAVEAATKPAEDTVPAGDDTLPSGEGITFEEIEAAYTVPELKTLAKEKGVDVDGNKSQIIAQLLEAGVFDADDTGADEQDSTPAGDA